MSPFVGIWHLNMLGQWKGLLLVNRIIVHLPYPSIALRLIKVMRIMSLLQPMITLLKRGRGKQCLPPGMILLLIYTKEEEEKKIFRSSLLAQTFSGLPNTPKSSGPSLPTEGLLVNAWSEVRKALPKITAFKARDRSLYRWPDSDFDKYGKVPDVDQAVSTFISSGQSSNKNFRKNSKSAKAELHPRDLQKENTFISLDQTLRSQQRAISHVLYMLTALSKGLKGDSECISYDDIKQLLGGLASTLSDVEESIHKGVS